MSMAVTIWTNVGGAFALVHTGDATTVHPLNGRARSSNTAPGINAGARRRAAQKARHADPTSPQAGSAIRASPHEQCGRARAGGLSVLLPSCPGIYAGGSGQLAPRDR